MARLPMFPLGSVLLPGAVLPLQVFEPRYVQMVGECLAGTPEFGVVLIERGSEVGGGDVRTDTGTRARIVAAEEVGGGRWHVVAVGTRRLRVHRWLEDAPYPHADVEDWPDAPASPLPTPAAYEHLLAGTRRLLALATEAGLPVGELGSAFAEDPALGTFEVAAALPLGPLDRQRVLATEGAAARVELLEELLEDARILLQARLEG